MKKALKIFMFSVALGFMVLAVIPRFFRAGQEVSSFTSEEGKEEFVRAYRDAMAALPKPQATMDIETAYGTVRVYYFTKEANRPQAPLLLLPGRSASTPMWEANLVGLLEERPVYTVDLLGEPGMSRQTAPIKTKEDQAKWLNQVITELGLDRVHLVGVSIGGWTAMNLARFYPERIASLSLLDPVFVFAPIPIKMVLASIPATVPGVPKAIREKMLSYISGGAEADESVPVAKLIESGMRNFKIRLPAPDLFKEEDLAKINRPVLALIAENSTMHDAQKAVATGKKYVRNIQIEIWPGASHAINGEFPEAVNRRILDFVNRIEGKGVNK